LQLDPRKSGWADSHSPQRNHRSGVARSNSN
jgi:hypothetical protein